MIIHINYNERYQLFYLKKALNASYNYITKEGKRYDEEYLFMNWARTVPGINQIPKIKYQSSKVLSTS